MTTRNVPAEVRVASYWAVRAGMAALLALAVYAVAGLIGGAIPVNRDWRPPARGVRVFVESNGVHVGIVVPKVAAGVDWRPLARPAHLADPRYGAHGFVAFGWGDRKFFLETPRWADLRPGTVVAAAVGSDRTLMHVEHIAEPQVGDGVRAITLRPEEYRRLAAYIHTGFELGGTRQRGYGAYDAFYEGRGRYSMLRTCNEWVGQGLREAGVRVGAWTPFPATVMNWF